MFDFQGMFIFICYKYKIYTYKYSQEWGTFSKIFLHILSARNQTQDITTVMFTLYLQVPYSVYLGICISKLSQGHLLFDTAVEYVMSVEWSRVLER